jgi:hypothetical protein
MDKLPSEWPEPSASLSQRLSAGRGCLEIRIYLVSVSRTYTERLKYSCTWAILRQERRFLVMISTQGKVIIDMCEDKKPNMSFAD